MPASGCACPARRCTAGAAAPEARAAASPAASVARAEFAERPSAQSSPQKDGVAAAGGTHAAHDVDERMKMYETHTM